MRARRSIGKIIVKNAQELIGGSSNMQLIFPNEDWAWTVENDLIVTKSSNGHIKPAISCSNIFKL
jgi:hypothetical protein